MPLTFSQLSAFVDQALASKSGTLTVPGTYAQIINEAGRTLVNAHQWNFLQRPPVSLSLTANQEYVNLPSDVGQVVAISASQTAAWAFRFTTMQALIAMRQMYFIPAWGYAGALVQPTQTNATTAPGQPRIELWPTPSSTQTNVLLMEYRAKWTEFSGSGANDYANIPLYAESLLVALVRAVAQGYEEDAVEDVTSRIDKVLGGSLFNTATEQDGMTQPTYGPIVGGAIEQVWNTFTNSWPISILAPSP